MPGAYDAVSKGVTDQLAAMGYSVTRFAGSNMFDTNRMINNAITVRPKKILLATGAEFYDALAAGAAAGANPDSVVVLT